MLYRKDFLNKKVEKETAEAKAKAKAKNKKGALSHLKRKKMLEKEVYVLRFLAYKPLLIIAPAERSLRI